MEPSKDVLDLVRGAGLIGAPTTEAHDMWSWPLRPAIAMAKEIGARLMLVDVSTRSAWTIPYGSGGVGADRGAPYSDGSVAVSIAELRLLGHDWLIQQVEEAKTQGVIAQVWLADRPGILALDRFLELFPIDVLVTPPLDHPSLADRFRQDEISAVRQRMTGRGLVIAREDGKLEVDRT